MKKVLILSIILTVTFNVAVASTTKKVNVYDSRGVKTGTYTQYSNGTIKERNTKGQVINKYKTYPNGKTVQYNSKGQKVRTYKSN